ncbi:ABC transporter permease [Luteolibacter sp. SL250]|uniref:ABC transporter permease n=1 Tax=Luteolibacter sp. SL250 TaxID=2995170 RepID=UPI00227216A6|nr:ABC transporter permease [Luteolibacter sp. SL250]WAC21592.1 ABC transporter permease [Luteolibacter sp. SL250]
MFFNTFLIALREIRRNLMRAFLTVLGIVIGVAAVITMVTLGRGATEAVKSQVSNLGSNLLVLRPGMGFGRGGGPGIPQFDLEDARIISEQVGGLRNVAALEDSTVSTGFLQKARSGRIAGTTPAYFQIAKWNLADGRFFEDEDVQHGAAVCVIGQTVKRELFGDVDPIGQRMRVKTASITVIGVLAGKGQTGFGQDQDDTIIMPLTTFARRVQGAASLKSIDQIMISGDDQTSSDQIINEVTAIMRERRNLGPNEDDNFNIMDTRQIAETLSSTTKVMTTLLGAVAGVSLLVGGIGIMNIMLVSVTERTREIGIRLAIGARAREVLLQFLVEAITLSSFGGLVGISFAFGLCVWLSKLIEVPFMFDPKINVIAFIFSAAVGILFGFMPARRAAALDPIEALRHE